MPTMPRTHRVAGQPKRVDKYVHDYRRRGTRQEQGYTNAWLRASAQYLREHPLCRMCEAKRLMTPSTLTDHIVPHRGDMVLFWDESNWQPLCDPCHNGPKRRIEEAQRRAEAARPCR